MAIHLIFFAQCADWMQGRSLDISVSRPRALRDVLADDSRLAPLLEKQGILKVAVNEAFAGWEQEVADGDEVAFFPPFSGG